MTAMFKLPIKILLTFVVLTVSLEINYVLTATSCYVCKDCTNLNQTIQVCSGNNYYCVKFVSDILITGTNQPNTTLRYCNQTCSETYVKLLDTGVTGNTYCCKDNNCNTSTNSKSDSMLFTLILLITLTLPFYN